MFKRQMCLSLRKVLMLMVLQFVFGFGYSQVSLTGEVTDENGNPLVGATLVLEGTNQGTTTNVNGAFRFSNLERGNYELMVSFMGYESQKKSLKLNDDTIINFKLAESAIMTEEVVVSALRAGEKAPVAVTNLNRDDLKRNNTGQDIPYQLSITPSLVESSESGNGVGYSALRIRGTDATRINVTVNGIPLNDSESQGVFWVNMPDFSSSVDNVQIQRGLGTSTNGAAAFGATINFQTQTLQRNSYAEYNSLAGSFNTFRNSVKVGTGMIDDKFSIDARYSRMKSDGFVDYAFSDHQSFFVTGAYFTNKSMLRINVISGDQHTGISWWGNPDPDNDRTYNPAGEYTDEFGNKQYYKDQTDNYKQTHYHLIYSTQLTESLNLNAALHYTKGEGYYEQYKEKQKFSKYGLEKVILKDTVISKTDLIRRKWLKNDFYGVTYSLNYRKNYLNASLGGAWNQYDGDHFGKIIWARYMGNYEKNHQWYLNNGKKTDYNLFAKVNYELLPKFNIYADMQYRHINYDMRGADDDLKSLEQSHTYDFFNPKMGCFYTINNRQDAYLSFGIGHREPTRTNFKDAKGDPTATPKDETLYDFEMGYNYHAPRASFGVNLYYMYYRDQLVPTGAKSSVGADIMTNVDRSYRAGVEFVWGAKVLQSLKWDGNLTLSRNRIKDFVEHASYYYDWNDKIEWYDKEVRKSKKLGDTHISYSPSVIASSVLSWSPVKKLGVNFISKYVGEQYFDNTSSDDRKVDDYFINNMRIDYEFETRWMKQIALQLQVNNLFNVEYSNNAYGGNYYVEDKEDTWSYYFPQAGINFMAGINLRF